MPFSARVSLISIHRAPKASLVSVGIMTVSAVPVRDSLRAEYSLIERASLISLSSFRTLLKMSLNTECYAGVARTLRTESYHALN